MTNGTTTSKNEPESHFQKAKALKEQRRPHQAIEEISRAIDLDQSNPEYFVLRGDLYSSLEQYDKALPDYRSAFILDQKNAYYCFLRAKAAEKSERLQEAMESYNDAVRNDRSNPLYHFQFGLFFRGMGHGHPCAAVEKFDRAIQLDPTNPEYHLHKAVALGDHEGRREELECNPFLRINRSRDEHAEILHYHDLALESFNTAITLAPESADGYRERGKFHFENENYPAARDDFSEAIRLEPKNGHHYYLRTRTWKQLDEDDKAKVDEAMAMKLGEQSEKELEKKDRQRAQESFLRGQEEEKKRNWAAAIDDFAEAIRFDNTDPETLHAHGKLALMYDEISLAHDDYTRAIELAPDKAENYNGLGLIRERKADELEDSMDHFRMKYSAMYSFSDAIERDPQNSEYYRNRARVYLVMNCEDDSRKDIDKALELAPSDYRNFGLRAALYRKVNEDEKAIADFSTALQRLDALADDSIDGREEERREFLYYRGQCRLEVKQFAESLEDWNESVRLSPQDAYVYLMRGAANFGLGEYEKVLHDLNTAIELKNDDPAFFTNRALIHDLLGDNEKAEEDRCFAERLQDDDEI